MCAHCLCFWPGVLILFWKMLISLVKFLLTFNLCRFLSLKYIWVPILCICLLLVPNFHTCCGWSPSSFEIYGSLEIHLIWCCFWGKFVNFLIWLCSSFFQSKAKKVVWVAQKLGYRHHFGYQLLENCKTLPDIPYQHSWHSPSSYKEILQD